MNNFPYTLCMGANTHISFAIVQGLLQMIAIRNLFGHLLSSVESNILIHIHGQASFD